MHIISEKHLYKACLQYPDAATEIRGWIKVVRQARWQNFPEVRQTFKDADWVDGAVIFNIRHNRYRMITGIHFVREMPDGRLTKGHVYILGFVTHKQYDSLRLG